MSASTIRRPVLDGHRLVDALWFPVDWFDEAARRRLLLAAWRPGATAHRFEAGDLIVWPQPSRHDCGAQSGWPMQRVAGALCSADVAPAELAGRPAADVWLVAGAELHGLRLDEGEPLDPSAWLSLDATSIVEPWDLRPREPERAFVGLAAPRDVRDVLGGQVPPASAESNAFLSTLRQRAEQSATSARGTATPSAMGSGLGAPRPQVPAHVILLVLLGLATISRQVEDAREPLADEPPAVVQPSGFDADEPPHGPPLGPSPTPSPSPSADAVTSSPVDDSSAAAAPAPDAGSTSVSPSSPGTMTRHDATTQRSRPVSDLLYSIAALFGAWWLLGALWGRVMTLAGDAATAAGTRAAARTPAPAVGKSSSTASGLRERMARVVPQRWRGWLARLSLTSGLAGLLGRQHAAYLRRMLEMFEGGDLQDALRHAVPLGDGQDSLGQMLGRLSARSDLRLAGQRRAHASIQLGNDLQAHLQRLYRRAFERLDREGRVDEAVFVLAELLSARAEALDYLEKHGRTAQAAELAIGWDMPPAQIIRLLAINGDWRRALLVARRDGAFGAAVNLLGTRWPDAATRLRREWAASLAAQSRWLEAMDALWPVAADRGTALRWLEHAAAAEGATGARALARRAQCAPETLAAHAAFIRALRDEPARAPERAALAQALLELEPPTPAARRLAATIAGALVEDHANPSAPLDASTLKRLVEFTGDALLRADLPDGGLPERVKRSLHSATDPVTWQAPPAGLHALFDAAPLADGEFLVALGEAGVLRLDAMGRRVGRIDTPAHRLVIAHDGLAALALAGREGTWRVSRLDLARSEARLLGQVAARAFSPAFDGVGWTIAEDRRVQVLDTTANGLRDVLWQVTDLDGPVVAIDGAAHAETWLVDRGEAGFEAWKYHLPKRTLWGRDEVPIAGSAGDLGVAWPVAGVGAVALHHAEDVVRVRASAGTTTPATVPLPSLEHGCGANAVWLVMRPLRRGGDGEHVLQDAFEIVQQRTGTTHAFIEWPRDAATRVRHVAGRWLVFDAQGRLAWLAPETGRFGAFSVR